MKVFFLLFLFLIFGSCAQRIKVPINRMMSPEVIGGGAEVDFRQTGFSAGVLDFAGNTTSNPLQMSSISENEMLLSLGVSDRVDFFVRVPKQSSSVVGLKIQLYGAPKKVVTAGHSLAFTLGMGNERDNFDSSFKITLKSDVTDYSLIHGYRFNSNFMVYEGISISNYHFQGAISGTTVLDSDEIDYEAQNILGAHGGIIAGGASFHLKVEFAIQKIKWTNTDEKLFHAIGYSFVAGW